MAKSKNKKLSKYLTFVSGFIILITTLCFGIIVPSWNSDIDKVERELSNVTEEMDRLRFNLHMNSDQLVKMASTYGTYKILYELDPLNTDEFEDHINNEVIQSIVILRAKGLNSTELDYYNNLDIYGLEIELKRQ